MKRRPSSAPCSCRSGCDCGCCAGTEPLTPLSLANRPGLDALVYRVGTWSSFLATMKARLSSADFPALVGLTTRDANDPSIALLDAWAVLADVLTFYQERIVNEGYLRTATERRSVLELARLVGYAVRPGVASSVYLAYTLEEKPQPLPAPVPPGASVAPAAATVEEPEIVIPAGARVQSVPGPGELPQPFETSEDLVARAVWNRLQVRLTRPQQPEKLAGEDGPVPLDFAGIATQLKPNDPLLIDTGSVSAPIPQLYRVMSVEADAAENRTRAEVQLWWQAPPPPPGPASTPEMSAAVATLVAGARNLKTSGVTAGATVRRVLARIESLGAVDAASLPARIEETLADLRQELANAEASNATRLVSWIGPLVTNLETVRTAQSATAVESSASDLVATEEAPPQTAGIGEVLASLGRPLLRRPCNAQPPPRNARQLPRDLPTLLSPGADLAARLLTLERPDLAGSLYAAWANVPVTAPSALAACALRTRASVFGNVAPLELVRDGNSITGTKEWDLRFESASVLPAGANANLPNLAAVEEPDVVYLDNAYPQITPGGWIVLVRPDRRLNGSPLVIARALEVAEQSRAGYGIAGRTTRVRLDRPWLLDQGERDTFAVIRGTAVYAQCDSLPLAEEPIPDPVCGGTLELGRMYDGLVPGRWLIVEGERADVGSLDAEKNVVVPVPGVPAAELVMLAGVTHGVARREGDGHDGELPGERTHTTLTLATPLAHCYRRDTLTVYGNVVHATHGETKAEALGSGDGGQAHQQFTLRQPPLTYVSAPTAAGIASTLEVRVDDLLWHEAGCLAGLGPTDHGYVTRTDDLGATTVVFGDGVRGARPRTGAGNVRARYRAGIGRPGNLQAGQIRQLATRPLGVKDVVNPLPATGGGDPESRDQARRNAPLAVMALDRLVSVEDYADFARTFAGVGKASAVRLSRGRAQLVHVTIAGEDDVPILATSDLFVNLGLALSRFGDPRQPVELALRDRRLLAISAGVRILPDSEWETVEPRIRAALLDTFGYPRRELGQPAFLSEVLSAIQGVRGVDYADVDVFDWVTGDPDRLPAQVARLAAQQPGDFVAAGLARVAPTGVQPAQLVYLSPAVPDTLILKELKS